MTANFERGPDTPTESTILSKIDTAIDNVVETLDLPKQEQAHVKRQKYTYLLIRRFSDEHNPPVTYSWFKWGVSAVAGPRSHYGSRSYQTPHPDAWVLLETNIEEFEQYLLNGIDNLDLSEWWEADHLDFLEQFYSHYGPEDYREIYLANIGLLKIIDDIHAAMQNGRDPVRPATIDDIQQQFEELQGNLKSVRHLREFAGYVSVFNQLLEGALSSLESLDTEKIELGHITVISELRKFYRDTVWLMIAHSISRHSAVGPNEKVIQTDSKENIDRLKEEFSEAFSDNWRRCLAMDMVPDGTEPPNLKELSEDVPECRDPADVVSGQRSDLGVGLDKRQQEAIEAFEEAGPDNQ